MRLRMTVAVALLGPTQTAPERQLPVAPLEFKEGFTEISAVRELRDGRVLVLDASDKTVRLVDLAHGTGTPVGRQGGGPGEYKAPSRLLPLAGDTTLLVDPGLQRSIVIMPGGTAGDVLLNSTQMALAPNGARIPQSADALGRLYFIASAIDPSSATPTVPDSAYLLRFDRHGGRVDTLARIKQARPNILVDREGTKIKSVNIRKVRFMPQDAWAVFPDGRVALVRTSMYRLDQRTVRGQLIHGPPVRYAPVAVTAAERDASPDPLPKFKPPFEGASAFPAPDGRVWIRRTTAASDSIARYDVFSPAGALVSHVAMAPRTRIAGFGKTVIYVVRRDQDDLEYLGRIGLTKF